MSQMRLFDMAHYAEMLERMEHKVDCLNRKIDAQGTINASIQWQLHAIILHLTGDRAALTAFVMASEPTVVPNEDEAMPVLTQSQYDAMTGAERLDRLAKAKCPQCDRRAYSEQTVESEFGYRTMADGKTIVQSWCRECRKLEQATSPRKKKSPTNWSDMCPKAAAFAQAVTSAKNAIAPLQHRLDHDKLTQSERADLQRRVDNFVAKGKAAKKQYNIRIKELGYVHPPSKSKSAK